MSPPLLVVFAEEWFTRREVFGDLGKTIPYAFAFLLTRMFRIIYSFLTASGPVRTERLQTRSMLRV